MDLGLLICSFLFAFVTFFLFSFAFDGKSLMQFVFHCPIRRGHKMIISLKPGSIMVLIFDGIMMVCRTGFYSPCGISAPAMGPAALMAGIGESCILQVEKTLS